MPAAPRPPSHTALAALPAAPWCVLLLGSGGRGESLLSADQDNAIVHAGSEEDDAWFAALGSHLADLLDEAGVRRCQGGIMAANAEWRGSVPAWRERVAGWLRRSAPEDLLHVDIQPKNRYQGGQSTNCKVNNAILPEVHEDRAVEPWIHLTGGPRPLEVHPSGSRIPRSGAHTAR